MKIFELYKRYFDVRLTLILSVFYTICVVLVILKISYFIWLQPGEINVGTQHRIDLYILDWLTVIAYMHLIAYTTEYFIRKRTSWLKIAVIHFVFSFIIGALLQVATGLYIATKSAPGTINMKKGLNSFVYFLDVNFLIYFSMVFIIYSYYYMKRARTGEANQLMLQTQLANTQMKMLISQLQPHFLFNTLNCISGLIRFDAKKAEDTLADLSAFFREVLNIQDSNFITVKKEIEILSHYLNILEVRFSEHIIIKQHVEDQLLDQEIPSLLLQPIIENSFKHGFSRGGDHLLIKIEVTSEEEYIIFNVSNNGNLLKETSTPFCEGLGLSNIRERLKGIYGSNYLFQIRNKKDLSGVETIIRVPKVLELQ